MPASCLCLKCGSPFSTAGSDRGRDVACPRCGAGVSVPALLPATAPPLPVARLLPAIATPVGRATTDTPHPVAERAAPRRSRPSVADYATLVLNWFLRTVGVVLALAFAAFLLSMMWRGFGCANMGRSRAVETKPTGTPPPPPDYRPPPLPEPPPTPGFIPSPELEKKPDPKLRPWTEDLPKLPPVAAAPPQPAVVAANPVAEPPKIAPRAGTLTLNPLAARPVPLGKDAEHLAMYEAAESKKNDAVLKQMVSTKDVILADEPYPVGVYIRLARYYIIEVYDGPLKGRRLTVNPLDLKQW